MCVVKVLYSKVPVIFFRQCTMTEGPIRRRVKPKAVMVKGFVFFLLRIVVREGMNMGEDCCVGGHR